MDNLIYDLDATVAVRLDTRRPLKTGRFPSKVDIYFQGVKKRYDTKMSFTEEDWEKTTAPRLKDETLKARDDTLKKLVKLKEASEFTGFEKKYIYNLVSQKAIPFIRVRNSLRFDLEELDIWMRTGQPKIVQLGLEKLREDTQP